MAVALLTRIVGWQGKLLKRDDLRFALQRAEIRYLDKERLEELVKKIIEKWRGKIEHVGGGADEDGVIAGSSGEGGEKRLASDDEDKGR